MRLKTMKKRIFGTDGVRGRANVEPVTSETALKLGRAAAHVFKNLERRSLGHGKHRIVIGKDTRLSGYMLENAISSGVLSMGVDVLFIGPLPTPGVAYVTRSLRADAGIVITASHNPFDDNGIKFFRADGFKLDDDIENEIEDLVFSGDIENIRPSAAEIGKAVRIDDALGRYIEFAKSSFPRGMTLDGMRIVLDCGHGAAYKAAPCILRELGAEVFSRQFEGRYSDHFNPEKHLVRLGVVNQTTMLATETRAIAELLRAALVARYGVDNIGEHFADTSDTLCYATNENQNATYALIERGADAAVVVGGYNSSNTSHIVELCSEAMPTYFVKGAEDVVSAQAIRHFSLERREVITTNQWLPSGQPAEVVLTCGASCPDVILDDVLLRIVSFYEDTREVEEVLEPFPMIDRIP